MHDASSWPCNLLPLVLMINNNVVSLEIATLVQNMLTAGDPTQTTPLRTMHVPIVLCYTN